MGNYTGVYGDHSTDGWLEWGLDQHFAELRAQREAKGDFGAQEAVEQAADWVERAETTEDLRRAEGHFRRAGYLAVKEALFEGVKINGWPEEEMPAWGELPPFERDENGETKWFTDSHLRHLKELPDRLQIVANLADNPWLRDIRQTGSRLIPKDREIRFARERVEEARRALDLEEAKLEQLQEIS